VSDHPRRAPTPRRAARQTNSNGVRHVEIDHSVIIKECGEVANKVEDNPLPVGSLDPSGHARQL
jgi:hypothetical protein